MVIFLGMVDRLCPQIQFMDTVFESVEVKRLRYRRHTTELKRAVVQKTLEPAASVARVARGNGVNAN